MKIDNTELSKDKNGNPMKVLTVGNNKVFVNSKYEKAVFEALKEDSDIEIVKVGDFWKVVPESLGLKETPRAFPSKSGQIKEAQDRKESSIEKAQERTADMWAKNNACEIIAHHPAYKDLKPHDVEMLIAELARNIRHIDIRNQPF